MLKFIKGHMETNGIEIYPLISFLLFFTFFLLVIIYVMRQDKQVIKELSNLPLEENKDDIS